jgi:hypothetical protein
MDITKLLKIIYGNVFFRIKNLSEMIKQVLFQKLTFDRLHKVYYVCGVYDVLLRYDVLFTMFMKFFTKFMTFYEVYDVLRRYEV